MKKIKEIVIKNIKFILGIITGSIITGTGVYAVTIASNNVTYDNTNSNLTSTNVQGAIDELYTKANSCNVSLKELGNSNIVSVKKYDEASTSSTYCVIGNEATCEQLAPTKTGTYKKGTIIDYKVNSSTTRRFHVIHDDGATLTLQDQKNIVDNVAWVEKEDFIAAGGTEAEWNNCTYTSGETTYYGCSTRGPLTILSALESATNSWTNVNLQTYTPGTTSFVENNKTGCTNISCSENTYTMGEQSGRARLITISEAWETGCQSRTDGTCPKYMYNYLKYGEEHDAVVDGNETSAVYWTMNAESRMNTFVWYIHYAGGINSFLALEKGMRGARAVVEINK